MRIVLVGQSEGDWRTYRQPRWMGEVRKSPELIALPRRYFDIDEAGYRAYLDEDQGGSDLPTALARLARHGASEVARAPG